jgi:hypothetical protein
MVRATRFIWFSYSLWHVPIVVEEGFLGLLLYGAIEIVHVGGWKQAAAGQLQTQFLLPLIDKMQSRRMQMYCGLMWLCLAP